MGALRYNFFKFFSFLYILHIPLIVFGSPWVPCGNFCLTGLCIFCSKHWSISSQQNCKVIKKLTKWQMPCVECSGFWILRKKPNLGQLSIVINIYQPALLLLWILSSVFIIAFTSLNRRHMTSSFVQLYSMNVRRLSL